MAFHANLARDGRLFFIQCIVAQQVFLANLPNEAKQNGAYEIFGEKTGKERG